MIEGNFNIENPINRSAPLKKKLLVEFFQNNILNTWKITLIEY